MPVVIIAHVGQSYVGWLVRRHPTEIVNTVTLGSFDQLHPAVEVFYRLCSDPASNLIDIHTLARQLYKSLFKPFEGYIGATPQIGIDLDSSLSILPVAALEEDDGNWLGNSHSFTLMPPWWFIQHQTPVDLPKISADDPILIVNAFPGFTDSADEAAGVANLFTHRIVLDATHSDRATILHQIGNAKIFHFSGHAVVEPASQLILPTNSSEASEVLTSDAIAPINLSRCHLVVLAACDTTATDPDRIETLLDLRTAFLVNGAGSVLASNWDVDDKATRTMMVDFYREILGGAPAERALQIAQKNVHSQASWKHPFYWAAFELFNH